MEYISSSKNSKILELCKLVSNKKERKAKGLFIAEGLVMLNEAISFGAKIETIVVSEEFSETLPNTDANIFEVPHHIIEKISDTKTPKGLIFSCKMPFYEVSDLNEMSKLLVLDSVADPGNVGTILRSAVAFGVEGIVFLNDCADVFSPKVVRSTMGAIFKIPFFSVTVDECFENINVPVVATFLDSSSIDIRKKKLEKSAIVLGNEANGISQGVLDKTHEKIIIPMQSTESLNVAIAGSIALWEAFRCQN